MSRRPTPTTLISSFSFDLLVRSIDNVLLGIDNLGNGCKIMESGTELRDLVQPVASDFSKLFDGISEAAKMFSEQKFLKSQLSADAHSVAVDVLKGLGNAHWVAVGLLAVANVLERFDNISANDRDCIDLLKAMVKLVKYLKQMKDIGADLHQEILECMGEAVKLIVSGAILCCSFISSNKLSKFVLTKKIRDELVYVRGKVDSMKADLMLQMLVLTITTFTSYHRQYDDTAGEEDKNCLGIIVPEPSEQSKDTESEIEDSCQTEVEGSGSDSEPDAVSSHEQGNYNRVNESAQVKTQIGRSLGLRKFLRKKIPTTFGLQKPSTVFKRDELQRATKRSMVKEIQISPIEFKRDELRRATKGFAKLIGRGGFGGVYFGILSDGRRVAVKVMEPEGSQGPREWMNEVRSLTKLSHRSIIELVGYCYEGDLMLVYEFISRNVENAILEENGMIIDWPSRLRIILDVIRGVAYLHEGADVCIVHRDVKPSNILLDENFNAKICDFGLARVMGPGNVEYANVEAYENGFLFLRDATDLSGHETTRVAGTFGYLAPEYIATGRLGTKVDIYAFGVTVLNVVSGKKALRPADELMNLTHLVCSLYERDRLHEAWRLHEEDRLHEIIDPRLPNSDVSIYSSSIIRAAKIALSCIQRDPKRRPSASRVLAMLLSEEEVVIPNERKDLWVSDFQSEDENSIVTSFSDIEVTL